MIHFFLNNPLHGKTGDIIRSLERETTSLFFLQAAKTYAISDATPAVALRHEKKYALTAKTSHWLSRASYYIKHKKAMSNRRLRDLLRKLILHSS